MFGCLVRCLVRCLLFFFVLFATVFLFVFLFYFFFFFIQQTKTNKQTKTKNLIKPQVMCVSIPFHSISNPVCIYLFVL